MPLKSAEAIFDLESYTSEPVNFINDVIYRWNGQHKDIYHHDGRILSQYARLMDVKQLRVRTYNADMVIWFAAGGKALLDVAVDEKLATVLTKAGIKAFVGCNPWVTADPANAKEPSALIIDRMDIANFTETILTDLRVGSVRYAVLHNIIDVASRNILEATRQLGINVEVVPGCRSFAVFDLQSTTPDMRERFVEVVSGYISRLQFVPEFLYKELRSQKNAVLLVTAFADLLQRTFDICADANRRLGYGKTQSLKNVNVTDISATGLALANAACALLDGANNPIAAIAGHAYMARVQEAQSRLACLVHAEVGRAPQLQGAPKSQKIGNQMSYVHQMNVRPFRWAGPRILKARINNALLRAQKIKSKLVRLKNPETLKFHAKKFALSFGRKVKSGNFTKPRTRYFRLTKRYGNSFMLFQVSATYRWKQMKQFNWLRKTGQAAPLFRRLLNRIMNIRFFIAFWIFGCRGKALRSLLCLCGGASIARRRWIITRGSGKLRRLSKCCLRSFANSIRMRRSVGLILDAMWALLLIRSIRNYVSVMTIGKSSAWI